MSERGQTETLGFVLVFALIISSIGLVYATGYYGLQDIRDSQRVDNAERAFEVLGDNMDDIVYRGAPSRATEIKLAEAELFLADAVRVTASVPAVDESFTYEIRPIVYSADTGTQIVYAQGAVIRDADSGGIVVQESTVLLNESRTILPVVQTRLAQGATESIAGSTTVLVRAKASKRTLGYSNTTASNTVWFNVTGTPRASIWRDYINRSTDATCGEAWSGTDDATCRLTTDRVRIVIIQIDVSLE